MSAKKKTDRLFGAHMSIAGGHANALRAAVASGCRTVQLFTKNNNQWNASPLDSTRVAEFRSLLAEFGLVHPIAHDSYLINLASPDDALWNRSILAATIEVERCHELGIADLVIHPGAEMGSGEEAGLKRIAAALNIIHKRTRGMQVTIDLETTAGQGSTLGHRFEHLQRILEHSAEPERLGICADTCHLFAAGYPLATSEEYNQTMESLELAVGIGRVRVWHLNDSVRGFDSRVDRHAGIGLGQMGLEPFRNVVNDTRFSATPLILETPKGKNDAGEELDIVNLQVLRGLVRVKSKRK